MSAVPVRFGPDSIETLSDVSPGRPVRVLLYAGVDARLENRVKGLLSKRDVLLRVMPDGLPDLSRLENLRKAFWQEAPSCPILVVGIGGGSVMDAAKAIRFPPDSHGPLFQMLDRPVGLDDASPHDLALIPTTAGTGSEVTATATVWNFFSGRKHSLFGPAVQASIAIVDPVLTQGCPRVVTRDAAVDALSHALEAIWNVRRTPDDTSLAISACELILAHLPSLLKSPGDPHLRERLALAALWAGQAMSRTETALVHALSYDDTLTRGLSHGEACGRWLPFVYEKARRDGGDVAQALEKALAPCITSAKEFALWLEAIGIVVVNPHAYGPAIDARLAAALASARGSNFSAGGLDVRC